MMYSIIIPVYNDLPMLEVVLKALSIQTFSKDRFEVIVSDNCSEEDVSRVTSSFVGTKLVKECMYKNSPYSARNRAIEVAKGNFFIFLDSTCIPVQNWLEAIDNCLKHTENEIIGGAVNFSIDESSGAAEIIDAHTSVKMKQSIERDGYGYTANLAARKSIFDEIGLFPEGLRSGGDVRWTTKAKSKGYKIGFCNKAIIFKAPRAFKSLIKKKWRVSLKQIYNWKEKGEDTSYRRFTHRFFHKIVLPPKPGRIKLDIKKYPFLKDISLGLKFKIWLVDYIVCLTEGIGLFVGLYKYSSNK